MNGSEAIETKTSDETAATTRTSKPTAQKRNRSPEKRNRTRAASEPAGAPNVAAPEPKKVNLYGLPNNFPDRWALFKLEQKRDESDESSTSPCVNGVVRRFMRGVWVVANWAFIEALRNASMPKYSNNPNENRRLIGHVQRYPITAGPYQIKGEDYARLAGIAKTREITDQEAEEVIGYRIL